jgi:hypothetical protein
MATCRCLLLAALLLIAVAAPAAAQGLPSEPLAYGDGRLVLGGDVTATIGPSDPGFFTYGTYEHSSLRELRMSLSASIRATSRLSLLAEVRSQNLEVTPFALYARIRPFKSAPLDVQVGRIPPTFGRASRLLYARDNPLIGLPLAYQYLTSLRPDAVPATADELLTMRARGWLAGYSVGNDSLKAGVPVATAFSFDTGIQVTSAWQAVTLSGAVTNGTLSNPRVADDNGGKQLQARVTVRPSPGLEIGSSFARGAFVSRAVAHTFDPPPSDSFVQQAYGLDMEYGRGHWLARAEGIVSEWRIPLGSVTQPLRSAVGSVEGRYAFLPGMYAAARLEHLAFSRITGSSVTLPWDAAVTRLEIGGGYSIRRNIVVRASWQLNQRDAGRIRSASFGAAQLLYWF